MNRLANVWMEDDIAVLFVTKQINKLAKVWMKDIITAVCQQIDEYAN